jgi:hypothetical protein
MTTFTTEDRIIAEKNGSVTINVEPIPFAGMVTLTEAVPKYKELTDEEILTAIKSIANDVGSYKEYENTYEDGWLDACNAVYDEVFTILKKAQE